MNWKEIKVSDDGTHFLLNDKIIFDKDYIEALKFHAPGLAPVKDKTGAYHITADGKELYANRYNRTFGYYCFRASIEVGGKWFHLDEHGNRVYEIEYDWTGNFQENICTVRLGKSYFHININGNRIYDSNYSYCGDFKDGIACVKIENGKFRHIDIEGNFIHNHEFLDLGVYHKGFATAKDERGYFHINKIGEPVYDFRFLTIEPFYNGFSLVTNFKGEKLIINELGVVILNV